MHMFFKSREFPPPQLAGVRKVGDTQSIKKINKKKINVPQLVEDGENTFKN